MTTLNHRASIHIVNSQRGVAILLALLVMAVLASLAGTAIATHWAQQSNSSTVQKNMQHDAILMSAQQWGQAILINDAKTTDIDSLEEPWATPRNPTSLTEFLNLPREESSTEAKDSDNAVVYSRIEDLTAKWNILSLRGTPEENQYQMLSRKIATDVGIEPERFIRLVAAAPLERPEGWTGGSSMLRSPQGPEACLLWLGLTAKEIALTKDLITCLPTFDAGLNLNTVPPKFFEWLFEPEIAAILIKERGEKPFQSITDAAQRAKVPESMFPFFFFGNPAVGWSVKSNWFAIHTQVTIGDISFGSTQTVHRLGAIIQVMNTIPVF